VISSIPSNWWSRPARFAHRSRASLDLRRSGDRHSWRPRRGYRAKAPTSWGHRAAGSREIDFDGPADQRGARSRFVRRRRRLRSGECAVRRSQFSVHWRRDPRRPDSYAGTRDNERLHSLDGDAGTPRRTLTGGADAFEYSARELSTVLVETVGVGQMEVEIASAPTRRSRR